MNHVEEKPPYPHLTIRWNAHNVQNCKVMARVGNQLLGAESKEHKIKPINAKLNNFERLT